MSTPPSPPYASVVPAQAGTHTPQQVLSARFVVLAMRNNDNLWLWVPAFAGTTLSLWRGGAPSMHRSVKDLVLRRVGGVEFGGDAAGAGDQDAVGHRENLRQI